MPRFSRGVLKLLAVVVAVGLSLPVGTSLVSGLTGRDYVRCIQQCNATRKACQDRCTEVCTDLFPGTPNKPQRDACIAACRTICGQQSDDCKLACEATPPPPTEQEP